MTPEQIESELKHSATKEDVALLKADLANLKAEMHKEFANHIKWIVALQLPTWLGIVGILLRK